MIVDLLAAATFAHPDYTGHRQRVETHSESLDWTALRWCESRDEWGLDDGSGVYGAYQFDRGTWASVGGTGLPSDASPAEQTRRAEQLYDSRGTQPWPTCGYLLAAAS